MAELKSCPACGFEVSEGSSGTCPRCLIRLESHDPRNRYSNVSAPTILGIIEVDMGPVQSIVLRDTEDGIEPPLIQSQSSDGIDDSIRYSIDGEIARGGMGSVFRGRDPDLGRPVAIKVLRTDLHNKPNMVRRFVEEAQIGGQLQHPGIVPIYEMGTFADRRPFFSMKLVKGHTLAALLESRKDPATELPRFLGIFEQIAQTMAYVHARGVIHRDLKPSNVMVGAFGEVQVMDWGLAKVLPGGATADDPPVGGSVASVLHTVRSDSHDDASVAGTVLGTPSYMAPEQARGQMEWIDERTDVFGLGSILCEILTGKPAFIGQSHREILMLTARGDLTETLKRLDTSGADQKLIELTRRCLDPEPSQRPHHAGEVNKAITAYLTGVQDRVRNAELERVKAEAMAVEERKRRRVTLALAASIMATMLIGGGGWVWTSRQHQTRVVNTALRVERALGEVKTALTQAEKSNSGDLTHWNEASASIRIAEEALGDTQVDRQLQDRVNEARLAIDDGLKAAQSLAEQSQRDRNLLRRFEEVRALNAKKGPDADDSRVAGYLKVFKEEGFDFNVASTPNDGKRFAGRAIAVEIAAALDDWAIAAYENVRLGTENSRRLLKIAQITDPDPWRNRLREAIYESDVGELRKLALTDKDELKDQPTPSLVLLGEGLSKFNEFKLAATVLTDAQRRSPGDYWINYTLGTVLAASTPPKYEEAIRYLSNAIAVRPTSGLTHYDLAQVLLKAGRKEESFVELETASNLWPEYEYFKQSQALTLHSRQQLEAASAVRRGMVAANPNDAMLRFQLGDTYYDKFSFEDAIESFRHAIRLKPDMALARAHLGRSLSRLFRFEEAIPEQRLGVGLGPTETETHEYYGVSLRSVGQLVESVGQLRMAIRLRPTNPSAHHYLGNSLNDLGLIEEAISEYHMGLQAPKRDGARHDLFEALTSLGEFNKAEDVVKNAERNVPERIIVKHLSGSLLLARGEPKAALDLFEQVDKEQPEGYRAVDALHEETRLAIRYEQLVDKLDELAKSNDPNLSPDDQIALADIALRRRMFLVATKLFADAFTRQDSLFNDPTTGLRFAAARAAIQAAFTSVDAHHSSEHDRQELLEQGLSWLRAELEAKKTTLLKKDLPPKHHNLLVKELRIWIRHRELAEVRDPSLSNNLSDVEINQWRAFWADVEAVLVKMAPSKIYDETIETLKLAREAVRQFPKSGSARVGLSFLLVLQGAVDEALDTISDAAQLTSESQEVYILLSDELQQFGRSEAVFEVLLQAIKHNPGQKLWHERLSRALLGRQNDEALAIYRRALKLDPNSAFAHLNLANALVLSGDLESALASLRQAVAIDGDTAGKAIRSLGGILRDLGRYDEALATFQKIGEIVRNSPDDIEQAKAEGARTQRFKALDSQLKQSPLPTINLEFPGEWQEFIESCSNARRFDKATHAWAAMLSANPQLGKDRQNANLYNASRMALKAGCGKQQNVTEADQAILRQQALNWLKADLANWANLPDQDFPENRELIIRWLNDWKRDPDLAGIRDEAALRKLPPNEQLMWLTLWQNVESLSKQARSDGWGGQFQSVTAEQLSLQIPSSFLFWENGPPLQPGHRRWTRQGNEIFVGQNADGTEFESKILGRMTLYEVEGTVSERIGDENLHYFIPDRGYEYAAVRERRLEKTNGWLESGILEHVEIQP